MSTTPILSPYGQHKKNLRDQIKIIAAQRGKIDFWREEYENDDTAYVVIAKALRELIEEKARYYKITVNIGAIAFAVDQCMKNIGQLLKEIPPEEEKALNWAYYAVYDDDVTMVSGVTNIGIAIRKTTGDNSVEICLSDPKIDPSNTLTLTLKQDRIHFEYSRDKVSSEIKFDKDGYAQIQDQRDEDPAWSGRIKNSVIPHIPEANLWTRDGEEKTMTDEEFIQVFPNFAKPKRPKRSRRRIKPTQK